MTKFLEELRRFGTCTGKIHLGVAEIIQTLESGKHGEHGEHGEQTDPTSEEKLVAIDSLLCLFLTCFDEYIQSLPNLSYEKFRTTISLLAAMGNQYKWDFDSIKCPGTWLSMFPKCEAELKRLGIEPFSIDSSFDGVIMSRTQVKGLNDSVDEKDEKDGKNNSADEKDEKNENDEKDENEKKEKEKNDGNSSEEEYTNYLRTRKIPKRHPTRRCASKPTDCEPVSKTGVFATSFPPPLPKLSQSAPSCNIPIPPLPPRVTQQQPAQQQPAQQQEFPTLPPCMRMAHCQHIGAVNGPQWPQWHCIANCTPANAKIYKQYDQLSSTKRTLWEIWTELKESATLKLEDLDAKRKITKYDIVRRKVKDALQNIGELERGLMDYYL